MDKESLVEQVKNLQRTDFGAKQAWWDFADKNGGGVRDPAKHDATLLSTFLYGFQTGTIKPITTALPGSKGSGKSFSPSFSAGAGKGGAPADFMAAMAKWMSSSGGGGGAVGGSTFASHSAGFGGGDSSLQDFIKMGQRNSISWKQAWQSYCTLNGQTYFDPAKYDKAFIVGFIEYLGQVANEDLAVAAAGQGVILEGVAANISGVKRPIGVGDGPAAKRINFGAGLGDPSKAGLVDRVKALQRSNQGAKEAWAQFCLDNLGGVKDPSRHDPAQLQMFLDQFGA